ncbi:hypothetical protein ACIRSU_10875 [Streptomyces sp. NPDC101160]
MVRSTGKSGRQVTGSLADDAAHRVVRSLQRAVLDLLGEGSR